MRIHRDIISTSKFFWIIFFPIIKLCFQAVNSFTCPVTIPRHDRGRIVANDRTSLFALSATRFVDNTISSSPFRRSTSPIGKGKQLDRPYYFAPPSPSSTAATVANNGILLFMRKDKKMEYVDSFYDDENPKESRDNDFYDNNIDKVRTKVVGQSRAEQELRNMPIIDREDDLEFDYYDDYDRLVPEEDDFYYDEGDDDDYNEGNGGNYWFNPAGLDMESGRKSRDRTRRPPMNDEVPLSAQKSARAINRRKTTFRSGTPSPPNMFKDFYDRLFWYGFDPDETTSPADRTMFGGTKGKFNGLALLDDLQNTKGAGRRDTEDTTDDKYDYDEDYYYEDDYEDDGAYYDSYDKDNESVSDSKKSTRLTSIGRRRKFNDFEPMVSVQKNRDPERSKSRSEYRNGQDTTRGKWRDDTSRIKGKPGNMRGAGYDGDDSYMGQNIDNHDGYEEYAETRGASSSEENSDYYEDEEYEYEELVTFDEKIDVDMYEVGRRRSTKNKNTGRRTKSSFSSNGQKENNVSSWFEDKEDGERCKDNETQRSSPIINLFDKVFKVDSLLVESQAQDYNRKLRLNKDGNPIRRSRFQEGGRLDDKEEQKRRKGYAYRYTQGNTAYESISLNQEMSSQTEKQASLNGTNSAQSIDIIDVQATVQANTVDTKKAMSEQINRNTKRRTWKDRDEEYARVPPKGVLAWGPEGEINGGIDVRTQAALAAIDEIKKAKGILQIKEEMVTDAEEEVILLKSETAMQKKRLLSYGRDSQRSLIIKEKMIVLNVEIEEAGRILRRAKKEAQFTASKVDELEDRHWALLSQYTADQELEKATQEEKGGIDILENTGDTINRESYNEGTST